MERLIEHGLRLGLEGEELRTFVKEQQSIEREERALEREREREREREEREREREERENARKESEREHELQLKRLELQAMGGDVMTVSTKSVPKLPPFIDHKDDLDSYLNRFERFARANDWDKRIWSINLSALLSGRALDVYSRLSEEDAADYDSLKEALLKRYDLTEDGFRNKFRMSKPEYGESPDQFLTRLRNYLNRWIDLSNTQREFEAVCDLFIKEQFITACPSDLAIYLKERVPSDLNELSKLADQYLMAHNMKLCSKATEKASGKNYQHGRSDKSFQSHTSSGRFNNRNSTANFYSATRNSKVTPKCIFCSNSHESKNCSGVQSMGVKARIEHVKSARACFLCLKPGKHVAKECNVGKPCANCNKRHHALLCDESTKAPLSATENASSTITSVATNFSPKVLLMTASVYVKGTSPEMKKARILIDGGSQRSYIRSSLAKSIQARTVAKETLQIQSFGERSAKCELDLVNVNLFSRIDDFSSAFKLLSTSHLCSPLDNIPVGPWITELQERGFILADETQAATGDGKAIDIIIGADQMWKIFTHNVFSTSYGVVASETRFGWVLQGPVSYHTCYNTNLSRTNALFTVDISKFWELESCDISETENESYPVIERFNSSIERESSGRYKVPLLWKEMNQKNLEPNYELAKRRLQCLNTKLRRNPELKKEYEKVFEEYEKMNIIEKVPDLDLQKEHGVFYLPHHAVVKEESKSTKVRPVFDGSASDKNGVSLNDLLDPGPSLMPQLVDLLLRFRQHAIPFTADIKKAFLQLSLKDADRDFLRFLWNDIAYRFRRVCFGIACAPFLLNATIHYHLTHTAEPLAEHMIESFYVDDLVLGSSCLEDSVSDIKTAIKVMESACMPLAKWTTSSNDLAKKLQNELDIEVQSTGTTRVLGVSWNLDTDELELNIPDLDSNDCQSTKRMVLSYTSKIFDPFGFASPIVVSLKIFLKSLWIKGYDWDTILSYDDHKQFRTLLESFREVCRISIPRSYNRYSLQSSKFSIHVFCDSSKQAYASCVYMQCCFDDQFTSSLIIAKTRLAPVKRVTLPRLELLACVLGTTLLKKVIKAMNIPSDVKIHCWSDSQIALGWIRNNASKYKQFVGNRIQSIQSVTPPSCWKHCPGDQNPADQATRASSFYKWDKSLWFHGPAWLNHYHQWPDETMNSFQGDEESQQELKPERSNVTCSIQETLFDVTRYSSLKKAVRTFVLVRRAIRKFKDLIRSKYPERTPTLREEMDESLSSMIKMDQEKYFSNEINALKNGERFPSNGPLKHLQLDIHDEFLVSVGRIDYDRLVILPHQSHLTRLIILEAHISLCHGGVGTTLTELRAKYWIPHGRRTVRSAIRSCLTCLRHDCPPYQQQEASLSNYRLERRRPFEITGCDYTGPFHSRDEGKVYLLIFTCTVVRAVHLEMCASLNNKDFFLAFRRFQARFGTPKVMISDNYRTFKFAKSSLQDILEWRFIPEYCPTWGGLWERLIRSVKNSLKRVLGSQLILAEILRTLFCEIESSINKRPLTYLSDDADDMKPLRPIDFFNSSMIEFSDENSMVLRKGFKEKNHHLERCWKRWKTEYLLQLREWHKVKRRGKYLPEVGDIVLVDPHSLTLKNRALWPLGRILKVFPGKGNFPRFVIVMCRGRLLRRSTGQIFPLETFEK